jgi:hypothetical protein
MGRAIGARLDWEILTTAEGVTKTDAGTMEAHALSRRYSSATLSTRSIREIHVGTDVFIPPKRKKKSGHCPRRPLINATPSRDKPVSFVPGRSVTMALSTFHHNCGQLSVLLFDHSLVTVWLHTSNNDQRSLNSGREVPEPILRNPTPGLT